MSASNNSASEFFNHLENEREAESDALNEELEQRITSAATSLNQIAAGFKKLPLELSNRRVVDFGGGKYDKAVDFCMENYFTVLCVLDPFNRSQKHNDSVKALFLKRDVYGGKLINCVTCFNVLNVLPTEHLVDEVCCNLFSYACNTIEKVVYISVYEGDKSGIGKETTKGYQRNTKLANYVPILDKYFSEITLKNGLLTCRI